MKGLVLIDPALVALIQPWLAESDLPGDEPPAIIFESIFEIIFESIFETILDPEGKHTLNGSESSTKKGQTGALWCSCCSLGWSRGALGVPWLLGNATLEGTRGFRRSSWEPLGASWGPLGASRANPLDVLKGILENHP